MAEQNNYNRPSQSSLRQVYVNFRFGVEPLFNRKMMKQGDNLTGSQTKRKST